MVPDRLKVPLPSSSHATSHAKSHATSLTLFSKPAPDGSTATTATRRRALNASMGIHDQPPRQDVLRSLRTSSVACTAACFLALLSCLVPLFIKKSEKTFSDKNFLDKMFPDKMFSDKMFSDKIFLDKMFLNKKFPDKKFSDKCLS
jgi:hypothetical protein